MRECVDKWSVVFTGDGGWYIPTCRGVSPAAETGKVALLLLLGDAGGASQFIPTSREPVVYVSPAAKEVRSPGRTIVLVSAGELPRLPRRGGRG